MAMAVRWVDGMRDDPGAYRSLSLWDNCIFPAEEVTLARFIELSSCSDEDGNQHVARSALRSQEMHARILRNSAACRRYPHRRAWRYGRPAFFTPLWDSV